MQSLVLAIVLESPLRREHLRLQVLTYKHLFPFLRHLPILVVSMQTEHETIFKVISHFKEVIMVYLFNCLKERPIYHLWPKVVMAKQLSLLQRRTPQLQLVLTMTEELCTFTLEKTWWVKKSFCVWKSEQYIVESEILMQSNEMSFFFVGSINGYGEWSYEWRERKLLYPITKLYLIHGYSNICCEHEGTFKCSSKLSRQWNEAGVVKAAANMPLAGE